MMLQENGLARVPNQLVSNEKEENGKDETDEEVETVREFSGVGGIVGHASPIDLDPKRIMKRKQPKDC